MHRGIRYAAIALTTTAVTMACANKADRPMPPTTPGSAASETQPAQAKSCDATKVRWAVGERASEDLLQRARKESGAASARFLRPNQPVTMEFLEARLNLELDEKDVVRSVRCG